MLGLSSIDLEFINMANLFFNTRELLLHESIINLDKYVNQIENHPFHPLTSLKIFITHLWIVIYQINGI